MYRIDLNAPGVPVLIPCTFVPSQAAPGKTLCVNEQGMSMVVEPDGSQVRWVPAGGDGYDSPYTQGTVLSGLLVYRSATPDSLGVPHGYKMVIP